MQTEDEVTTVIKIWTSAATRALFLRSGPAKATCIGRGWVSKPAPHVVAAHIVRVLMVIIVCQEKFEKMVL